ncbi:hypothetical protein H8D29_03460 [PVC group bacterium]|nr:hypothetical protein [PVC group bacterium]
MKESTTTTKITDGIELLEAEYAMYIMFGEMEKDIRENYILTNEMHNLCH